MDHPAFRQIAERTWRANLRRCLVGNHFARGHGLPGQSGKHTGPLVYRSEPQVQPFLFRSRASSRLLFLPAKPEPTSPRLGYEQPRQLAVKPLPTRCRYGATETVPTQIVRRLLGMPTHRSVRRFRVSASKPSNLTRNDRYPVLAWPRMDSMDESAPRLPPTCISCATRPRPAPLARTTAMFRHGGW